jgi:ABC-type nitrate/sulfonate/bicarbonate transport system substrate-binding protein
MIPNAIITHINLTNALSRRKKKNMFRVWSVALLLAFPGGGLAQAKVFHSYAGLTSSSLALWAAKDLNLFAKYRLDVDFVYIAGGPGVMQSLIAGNTQSADTDAVAPVRAILRGGDAVIVAGVNNKPLFKFVTQKEITEPSQLRKKRIGVASFGGTNEFMVTAALREWNIPREAVVLVAAGGSGVRLAAMEKKALDATVLPYDQAALAVKEGMHVLADLPTLVPSFPDKVIIMRRSFVQKERDTVKRFVQGLSEAIYQIALSREKGVAVLKKRLGGNDPKVLEENYNVYGRIFAFPPRVGRDGLERVLGQVQQQTGGAKTDFELTRFLDESIIDDLEREGFFKSLSNQK